MSAQAVPAINFADFSDVSALTLNGDAAQAGTALRLAPAASFKKGSAYFSSPVQTASFQTRFQFLLQNFGLYPADGLTFVLQSQGVNALGGGGSSLGYGGITTPIRPSVAVFIDAESGCGPKLNVATNASASLDGCSSGTVDAPFDLYGSPVTMWVDYDQPSTTLSVYLSQDGNKPAAPLFTRSVDIKATVGDTAYVGFTAATGSGHMNHDILNWSSNLVPVDTTPPPPAPASAAARRAATAGTPRTFGWTGTGRTAARASTPPTAPPPPPPPARAPPSP